MCMWFVGAVQEELYTDGSWKGTQCFQCQPGQGFFCPLTTLRPDERFTSVGETLRGAAAVPRAASAQSCKDTT